MGLFRKPEPPLSDEMTATDVLSRGGSEEEVRAALGLPGKYKLYRDETACDSDDFGPPYGKYPTLALAMAAAGLPVSAWQTDRHCPDEIFTFKPASIDVDWQLLAPSVAAEFTVLAAA